MYVCLLSFCMCVTVAPPTPHCLLPHILLPVPQHHTHVIAATIRSCVALCVALIPTPCCHGHFAALFSAPEHLIPNTRWSLCSSWPDITGPGDGPEEKTRKGSEPKLENQISHALQPMHPSLLPHTHTHPIFLSTAEAHDRLPTYPYPLESILPPSLFRS